MLRNLVLRLKLSSINSLCQRNLRTFKQPPKPKETETPEMEEPEFPSYKERSRYEFFRDVIQREPPPKTKKPKKPKGDKFKASSSEDVPQYENLYTSKNSHFDNYHAEKRDTGGHKHQYRQSNNDRENDDFYHKKTWPKKQILNENVYRKQDRNTKKFQECEDYWDKINPRRNNNYIQGGFEKNTRSNYTNERNSFRDDRKDSFRERNDRFDDRQDSFRERNDRFDDRKFSDSSRMERNNSTRPKYNDSPRNYNDRSEKPVEITRDQMQPPPIVKAKDTTNKSKIENSAKKATMTAGENEFVILASEGKIHADDLSIAEQNLPEPMKNYLHSLGYTCLSQIQSAVYEAIKEHKSVFICSQTGTGKTLAYILPLISEMIECDSSELKKSKPITTDEFDYSDEFWKIEKNSIKVNNLIITPNSLLLKQVMNTLSPAQSSLGITSCNLMSLTHITQTPSACFHVTTLDRFNDLLVHEKIDLTSLNSVTLDEADLILEENSTLMKKVVKIVDSGASLILVSSTLPQLDIIQQLHKFNKDLSIFKVNNHKLVSKVTYKFVKVPQNEKTGN